jgi:hypothetical protein
MPFYSPIARAKTPTTPAMLATIAPVGAGAPPVELEVDDDDDDDEAAEADAADR